MLAFACVIFSLLCAVLAIVARAVLLAPHAATPHTHDPVFLLHGLGAAPWTLFVLRIFLTRGGFPHVYAIPYNVDTSTIEASVESASHTMTDIVQRRHGGRRRVFLVGHSWGGLVAMRLHQRWNVQGAIAVASPLHGSRVLQQWCYSASWSMRRLFDCCARKSYLVLVRKAREAPPSHPYHSISTGWCGSTGFDGCVYRDEATLCLDGRHHTHVPKGDHRFLIASMRVLRLIHRVLVRMASVRN